MVETSWRSRSRRLRGVRLLLAVAIACCGSGVFVAPAAGAPLAKHVILVDWDGFGYKFLNQGYSLPNVNALISRGSLSQAQSVFQSFSNPARASMSTGAYPERTGNVAWVFDPPSNLVLGQTRQMDVESIAEALERPAGTTRTVASVQWYMVQDHGTAYGDPSHLYVQPGGDFSQRVDVAIDILNRRPVNSGGTLVTVPKIPDFLAVYGPQPDEVVHQEGTHGPDVGPALEAQDAALGRLVQATKDVGIYDDTAFVVTADHDMTDWNKSALATLTNTINSAGYSSEVVYSGNSPQTDPDVVIAPAVTIAHLTLRGNKATDQDRQKLRTALEAHPTEFQRVLGAPELTALHASLKLGDLVVEARPPWSFAKADLAAGTYKGAHGSENEFNIPLILAGAGIAQGQAATGSGLVDVAPTISALLDAPCPFGTQGRPLTETFTSSASCGGVSATPPTAVTGSASRVGKTSATLNGSIDPNGQPTSYQFEYGTSTAYGSSTPTASAGSGTGPVDVSATVTGLTRATTYHFRLVAIDAQGGRYPGTDATFRTRRK